MGTVLYAFLFLFGVFSASGELVPVYMMHTTPTKGLFSAMAHINHDTFKEILLQKQGLEDSNKILVFAEENLSPEDFSDQNSYQDLSNLKKPHYVTYLPTVDSPVEGIQDFASQIRITSIDDVINDSTLLDSPQLMITLNDAQEDEDRAVMLKRHCKFIVETYEKVLANNGNSNILVIYTGSHSSWIVPNTITNLKRERRATEDSKSITTEHFLLYYSGPFAYVDEKGTSKNLTINTVAEADSKLNINTNEGTVTLNYVVDGFQNWVVNKISYAGVDFDGSFYTPIGFSYSCSSGLTYKVNSKNIYLTFPTFQMQYFPEKMEEKPVFYDSYDCMGFTSVPIWSGLFVTFILAIIMSIGLTMIMDIKTMDRFDDPKGKTIIINATD